MFAQLGSFWRVNSYGYPNPFSTSDKSKQAWDTLLSFSTISSYSQLKRYWISTTAPRQISPHGVESWKATFEEFGLLYVLTGSDDIVITPAGNQFVTAGLNNNISELTWIGLNLLLRYPLNGFRRQRDDTRSDLLLYWFFYASMRELQNYLWRSEINRILCKVTSVNQTQQAIDIIKSLRSGELEINQYPLPSRDERGAFYNSINQVLVHAGMNYLILEKSYDDSFYNSDLDEQKIYINGQYLQIVDQALGKYSSTHNCDDETRFISRMPRARITFDGEEDYFEYLGANVDNIPTLSDLHPLREINIEGNIVSILEESIQYHVIDNNNIQGQIAYLCRLAKGQRLVLSHDLRWSFIIEDKRRSNHDQIVLTVKHGRPIINPEPIVSLMRSSHE